MHAADHTSLAFRITGVLSMVPATCNIKLDKGTMCSILPGLLCVRVLVTGVDAACCELCTLQAERELQGDGVCAAEDESVLLPATEGVEPAQQVMACAHVL